LNVGLLQRVRQHIPSREQLQTNRWLTWLRPWLQRPQLWHWSRRGVALGVSIGLFFGLLIPVAQIPLSVAASVVLRANVPAAAVSTLISNPLTYGPIYYGAYRLGLWATGETGSRRAHALATSAAGNIEATVPSTKADVPAPTAWQRIRALGKPLLVGMALSAAASGLLAYGLITVGWRLQVLYKRRKRRHSETSNNKPP
jgi:uncharacterized protein